MLIDTYTPISCLYTRLSLSYSSSCLYHILSSQTYLLLITNVVSHRVFLSTLYFTLCRPTPLEETPVPGTKKVDTMVITDHVIHHILNHSLYVIFLIYVSKNSVSSESSFQVKTIEDRHIGTCSTN